VREKVIGEVENYGRNSPQSVSSAAFLNAQPAPHQPRRMASGPDAVREDKRTSDTAWCQHSKKALFTSKAQK